MPPTIKILKSISLDKKIVDLLPKLKIQNLSKLTELAIMTTANYFFEDEIREELKKYNVEATDEEIREVFLKIFPFSQNVISAIEKTVVFLVRKKNRDEYLKDINLKIKYARENAFYKKVGLR